MSHNFCKFLSLAIISIFVFLGSSLSPDINTKTAVANNLIKNVTPDLAHKPDMLFKPDMLQEVVLPKNIEVSRSGEVYLFRGLFGIWSTGIDELADGLRASGIYAIDDSHTNWRKRADQIVAKHRAKQLSGPVFLVGHSLGANILGRMADFLAKNGVRVRYIVSYDPTVEVTVSSSVRLIDNYYLPNSRGREFVKGPGFKGKIRNIDLTKNENLTHTNLEKDKTIHKGIIKNIRSMTRRIKRRTVSTSS